ncbi:MAG: OmpA family protein [Elusimicrobia bacterium]|nr:OmpA family protein [Elusimicrobiota bacterium]
MKWIGPFLAVLFASVPVLGAEPEDQRTAAPLYQFNIAGGPVPAMNYQHLKKRTVIGFRGTALLPKALGTAKIKPQPGAFHIQASFKNLSSPDRVGQNNLTYVLWALSPEGRATNLGEILRDGNKGHVEAITPLPSFALVVTAEPYFAVAQMGGAVVMENVKTKDTSHKVGQAEAKYELLPRNQYTLNLADLKPIQMDKKKIPFHLYQARNAVQIARSAGAETYAADAFKRVEQLLQEAETSQQGHKGSRVKVPALAKEAVVRAEDARLLAEKNRQEEMTAKERTQVQEKLAQAQQQLEMTRTQAEAQQQSVLQQAEREQEALRDELKNQLSRVMETQDTARGLVVNMSDVLFESGKHALKPPMREKLAKVAGVLITHPELNLAVEGYTDNVGSEGFNRRLSENRAAEVRDYLIQQGIPEENIQVRGFGEMKPLEPNDTPEGRQRNRRVELIVTGEAIGDGGS